MCTSKRSQSPANEWIFFFSSNFEPHRLLRDVRRADDPATHQRVVENKFGSWHFGALFSGWIPNQFSKLSASHEMFWFDLEMPIEFQYGQESIIRGL